MTEVGGSFEGRIVLFDMHPPSRRQINVSGEGTLGTGVGQRVLMGVVKHYNAAIFTSSKKTIHQFIIRLSAKTQ